MAKVLLVEDDNNLREIYEARLTAEGYEISSASDGEEALVVAKQTKPDLVISDVMMPKISGFEMLDILRNTEGLEHVKVIMLTALGQGEDRDRADSLGADKYLVKSQVTLEDIVKTAHELLGEEGVDTPAATSSAETSEAPVPTEPAPAPAAAEPEIPVASPPTEQTTPTPVEEPTPTPPPATPQSSNDAGVDPSTTSVSPASDDAADDTTVTPSSTDSGQDIAGSIAQEEAIVQDQIDNFVENVPTASPAPEETQPAQSTAESIQPASTSAAPTEEATAPPPVAATEPESAPEEPVLAEPPVDVSTSSAQTSQDNAAADDQLMANAVDELASESATPVETPADEASVVPVVSEPKAPSSDIEVVAPTSAETTPAQPTEAAQLEEANEKTNISISGKKVIQPLDSEPKPDINELLAREEATNPDLAAGTPIVSSADSDTSDENTAEPAESPEIIHKPGQSFSPQPSSESPAPTSTTSDDQPSGAPAPSPSQKKDDFDPNSIAL